MQGIMSESNLNLKQFQVESDNDTSDAYQNIGADFHDEDENLNCSIDKEQNIKGQSEEPNCIKDGNSSPLVASPQNSNVSNTSTINTTQYQTIEIMAQQQGSKYNRFVTEFSMHPQVFEVLMSIIISILVWLTVYTIVGSAANPGGIVFVIVFLEFGGRIIGYLVSKLQMPPMVGMLGLGLLIRNVPYLDFGKSLPSDVASPIRQLSLAIILTRAGLGLDLNVLLKFKWLIAKLAFVPTFLEALSVGVIIHFALHFPWLWSLLGGFLISAVSPAVIVPRILLLKEQGYGVEKGIPTIILAAASLDNIVAISFFGVVLGFTFSTKSMAYTIMQGPMEIILGTVTGLIWGFFTGLLFSPDVSSNKDKTVMKTLMVLGGGISSVLGYNKLGFSGAGVLSCLISAFTAANLWRKRDAAQDLETIRWSFTFLWKFFEPLLFGVIGCAIDLSSLDMNVVAVGTGCLVAGAIIRFVTTYLMVSGNELNVKEKLFFGISWIPKATVQAALGPMALDLARISGNKEDENLGFQVLTLAVLVILLTAPIGELAVILTGPRFLSKKQTDYVVAPSS